MVEDIKKTHKVVMGSRISRGGGGWEGNGVRDHPGTQTKMDC